MIAAVFIPRKLVATSAANWALLAAITAGETVIAKAVSNAAADAIACEAAR